MWVGHTRWDNFGVGLAVKGRTEGPCELGCGVTVSQASYAEWLTVLWAAR